MTTRAIVLISTLLFSVPLFAREKSDVIVMKNEIALPVKSKASAPASCQLK